jgi:hypothetical protein
MLGKYAHTPSPQLVIYLHSIARSGIYTVIPLRKHIPTQLSNLLIQGTFYFNGLHMLYI